jgi:hypothetical protein
MPTDTAFATSQRGAFVVDGTSSCEKFEAAIRTITLKLLQIPAFVGKRRRIHTVIYVN